jgi:hypothetical protein
MDDSGLHGGFEWEDAEDITALSERELRGTLEALAEEERALDYRLKILQGRIDLVRSELVEPGAVACSSARLARVLLGDLRDEEIG